MTTPTRDDLRAAELSFNADPANAGHWADVLATEDQQGPTLTLYRGRHGGQVEPLARWVVAREGEPLVPLVGYGMGMTDDERAVAERLVAGLEGPGG
jgi:hypothetical protein